MAPRTTARDHVDKTFLVRMPAALKRRLDAYARRTGRHLYGVVNQAVEELLDREERKEHDR